MIFLGESGVGKLLNIFSRKELASNELPPSIENEHPLVPLLNSKDMACNLIQSVSEKSVFKLLA